MVDLGVGQVYRGGANFRSSALARVCAARRWLLIAFNSSSYVIILRHLPIMSACLAFAPSPTHTLPENYRRRHLPHGPNHNSKSNPKPQLLILTLTLTSMSDLLTVGPKLTRPACRAAAAAIDRCLLPAPDLCSKLAGRRCCCRSTGQTERTDEHATVLRRLPHTICGRRNNLNVTPNPSHNWEADVRGTNVPSSRTEPVADSQTLPVETSASRRSPRPFC